MLTRTQSYSTEFTVLARSNELISLLTTNRQDRNRADISLDIDSSLSLIITTSLSRLILSASNQRFCHSHFRRLLPVNNRHPQSWIRCLFTIDSMGNLTGDLARAVKRSRLGCAFRERGDSWPSDSFYFSRKSSSALISRFAFVACERHCIVNKRTAIIYVVVGNQCECTRANPRRRMDLL